MPRRRNSAIALALALGAALAGCDAAPAQPVAAPRTPLPTTRLGVMSSLPLFWPIGAELAEIASGTAPLPWQHEVLAGQFLLEPLDTLAPVPGLAPDAPATDPLAGLTRLAVVQPRGLSPADNVALDSWVRGGGRLLLMLDPALTGDYDLPLGDPRRPVEAALIPPVVARWGMAVRFDEEQDVTARSAPLGAAALPLAVAGEVTITDPAAAECTLLAGGAAARCAVGKGRVTLIADAALFEHPELAGEGGAVLAAVLREAFA
jgi:hypothetical protein